MNKSLVKIVGSFLFLLFGTVNANAGAVGISISQIDVDGTGKEIVDNTNSNTGSKDETISGVPSIFIESEPQNGWVFGLDYIPVGAQFVSSSKTQTNITSGVSATESKTQKVEGDLDEHITFYVEKDVYNGVYLKAGIISVQVTSNESIGTGSTYGDDSLMGTTVGLGYKHDMDNMFIKAEVSMSDYDTIELSSTNTTNSVTGDIDTTTAKLAIGYKF
tara:strand:- start:16 stop:669 length:654 start_codon:yes stop_codon:yes gene_type:complete